MALSLSPTDIIDQWIHAGPEVALEAVMEALLQLEKSAKKRSQQSITDDFIGDWHLRFIGGKQSPNASSQALKGSGTRVPQWLDIQMTYQYTDIPVTRENSQNRSQGLIVNRVNCGRLTLELSGPWVYNEASCIMAFDFLYLKLFFFERSLLSFPIRGGKNSEDQFWEKPLKEKAFFRYFWVTSQMIAARGKGGGIALWSKVESQT